MTEPLMPCGHPQSCVLGRVTMHCDWCAAQADADHHVCVDCNVQNPMIFMVTDEAWAWVAQPDEWLCWGCYNKRRFEGHWPLPRAADLTDAPCNADFGRLMECFEEAQADAHDAHERAEAAEGVLRNLPPTSAWQASAEAACQILFSAVPSFQRLDVANIHREVEHKAKNVVEELERLRAEVAQLRERAETAEASYRFKVTALREQNQALRGQIAGLRLGEKDKGGRK